MVREMVDELADRLRSEREAGRLRMIEAGTPGPIIEILLREADRMHRDQLAAVDAKIRSEIARRVFAGREPSAAGLH